VTAVGGPEAFAATVDTAFDAAAAYLTDPGAVRRLILGATA
jgi:hypothetical protein